MDNNPDEAATYAKEQHEKFIGTPYTQKHRTFRLIRKRVDFSLV